jgi:hypothetical protein
MMITSTATASTTKTATTTTKLTTSKKDIQAKIDSVISKDNASYGWLCNSLLSLPIENVMIVCDYVIAMISEDNISESTRRNVLNSLTRFLKWLYSPSNSYYYYYYQHLPFEVRVAVSSLNKILYNLYNIQSLEAAKIEGRHVSDTNRIQALSVMKDVVKMKIDVLTNTATLKEALSFVEDKRAEIQKYRSEIDRIAIEDKQQVTVNVDVDVDNNINDAIIEQTTNKEDQNVSITGNKYYNDKDNYNLNQEEEQLALEDRGIMTTTTKEEENNV